MARSLLDLPQELLVMIIREYLATCQLVPVWPGPNHSNDTAMPATRHKPLAVMLVNKSLGSIAQKFLLEDATFHFPTASKMLEHVKAGTARAQRIENIVAEGNVSRPLYGMLNQNPNPNPTWPRWYLHGGLLNVKSMILKQTIHFPISSK